MLKIKFRMPRDIKSNRPDYAFRNIVKPNVITLHPGHVDSCFFKALVLLGFAVSVYEKRVLVLLGFARVQKFLSFLALPNLQASLPIVSVFA